VPNSLYCVKESARPVPDLSREILKSFGASSSKLPERHPCFSPGRLRSTVRPDSMK